MVHSIDAVARLTGISAFTLRNWEKRYEFLKPKRLGNGFRAYDDAHIELLRRVSALLSHGARIGDLAESISKGNALPEIHAPAFSPEVQVAADSLYSALMGFDLKQAETIQKQLAEDFEPSKLLDLVYLPFLGRLGRSRSAGEINPAQMHFAGSFLRMRLAAFLAAPLGKNLSDGKKALCAATSSELHETCLMLLLAAHLKLKGWSTYYLGPGLPVEHVHAAAQSIRPDVVCLTFNDKHGIYSSLDHLSRFECKVCIGGFGALTFDGESSLPSHLHLLKKHGGQAVASIEALSE